VRPQLAGQCPGQERLAAAGRSVEQQPAAQALAVEPAQLRVAHRGQEGRLEPLLHLGHPADVGQAEPAHLDVVGRHAGLLGLAVGEHRRHELAEVLLRGEPVERVGGGHRLLLGPRRGGPVQGGGHQRAAALGGRILLQHQGDVRHRLAAPAAGHEQLGEMQPQGGVLGYGLDGTLQARDQLCVAHWSPSTVWSDCDSPGQPRR